MSNWFWIGPTLAAILTFIGYALFKYLQGEFNPGLTISYSHSRVSISPGQTLLFLEVEALNSSKVPVNVRYMEVTLRRLSRYTDEEVDELYSQAFPSDGSTFQPVGWEWLFTIPRLWNQGECTIQPGESHFETFEFIIPRAYDTIPIRVEVQFVNEPFDSDGTFSSQAKAWRRNGIIAPETSEVEGE